MTAIRFFFGAGAPLVVGAMVIGFNKGGGQSVGCFKEYVGMKEKNKWECREI